MGVEEVRALRDTLTRMLTVTLPLAGCGMTFRYKFQRTMAQDERRRHLRRAAYRTLWASVLLAALVLVVVL